MPLIWKAIWGLLWSRLERDFFRIYPKKSGKKLCVMPWTMKMSIWQSIRESFILIFLPALRACGRMEKNYILFRTVSPVI